MPGLNRSSQQAEAIYDPGCCVDEAINYEAVNRPAEGADRARNLGRSIHDAIDGAQVKPSQSAGKGERRANEDGVIDFIEIPLVHACSIQRADRLAHICRVEHLPT